MNLEFKITEDLLKQLTDVGLKPKKQATERKPKIPVYLPIIPEGVIPLATQKEAMGIRPSAEEAANLTSRFAVSKSVKFLFLGNYSRCSLSRNFARACLYKKSGVVNSVWLAGINEKYVYGMGQFGTKKAITKLDEEHNKELEKEKEVYLAQTSFSGTSQNIYPPRAHSNFNSNTSFNIIDLLGWDHIEELKIKNIVYVRRVKLIKNSDLAAIDSKFIEYRNKTFKKDYNKLPYAPLPYNFFLAYLPSQGYEQAGISAFMFGGGSAMSANIKQPLRSYRKSFLLLDNILHSVFTGGAYNKIIKDSKNTNIVKILNYEIQDINSYNYSTEEVQNNEISVNWFINEILGNIINTEEEAYLYKILTSKGLKRFYINRFKIISKTYTQGLNALKALDFTNDRDEDPYHFNIVHFYNEILSIITTTKNILSIWPNCPIDLIVNNIELLVNLGLQYNIRNVGSMYNYCELKVSYQTVRNQIPYISHGESMLPTAKKAVDWLSENLTPHTFFNILTTLKKEPKVIRRYELEVSADLLYQKKLQERPILTNGEVFALEHYPEASVWIDTMGLLTSLLTDSNNKNKVTIPNRWRLHSFHDHLMKLSWEAKGPGEALPKLLLPSSISLKSKSGRKWTFMQPSGTNEISWWARTVKNCVSGSHYIQQIKNRVTFIILCWVEERPCITVSLYLEGTTLRVREIKLPCNKPLDQTDQSEFKELFTEALETITKRLIDESKERRAAKAA